VRCGSQKVLAGRVTQARGLQPLETSCRLACVIAGFALTGCGTPVSAPGGAASPCGASVGPCSITVLPKSIALRVGDSFTFVAYATADVPNPRYRWDSSDASKVGVDSLGRSSARLPSTGTAICATPVDGGKEACGIVTVAP
jgi:uncharacterized protein YjdB